MGSGSPPGALGGRRCGRQQLQATSPRKHLTQVMLLGQLGLHHIFTNRAVLQRISHFWVA